MGAVKMNITLPEKTAKKLKSKIKPRERSSVIAEALEMFFSNKSRESLVDDLIEGYKSQAKLCALGKKHIQKLNEALKIQLDL